MECNIRNLNDKRIDIMIIISRFDKCGPNRELISIIKELQLQLFNVYILTLFCEKKDSDIDAFVKTNVNIKQANIKSNMNFWKIRHAIRKYEQEWNPNIVYCYGLSVCFHASKVITDKSLYCTLRNNAYFDLKKGFGSILGKVGEYMTDYYVNNIDYNICCSKTLQKIYQERFPNKTIYCIQNGTDVQKFQLEKKIETIEQIKRELNLENKIIFLVSGSLDKRKDPITIIKAFIKAGIDDKAVLIFVGTGVLEIQCRDMVNQDNIIFEGFVDNVEKYYKIADVYISASHSEGLPNSVLEAGACGCRMVLSDIPQHKEIFEEYQENVSYFEIEDVEELSKLIKENVRHTLVEERELISKYINMNFSNKKMSQKYCEFFKEILNDENR